MALMLYNPPTPLSWERRSLKRLPLGAMPIKLIGEGAANVVFEIGFPPDYHSAPTFQGEFLPLCLPDTHPSDSWANTRISGWLLRVSKAPANGEPSRFNYLKQQEYYAKQVRYLLRDHIIQQELVVVRGSNIVRKLNNFLTSIDHERKEKFRGTYVADTNWGFLVEDMRPKGWNPHQNSFAQITNECVDPADVVLIEFKPKWLLQSPSAPTDATRCRQCALELFNFIKDPSIKRDLPNTKHCPLFLGNKNAPAEFNDPFRIAPKLRRHIKPGNHHDLTNVLRCIADHRVIHDLRAAQKLSDPDGPLFASRSDETFNFAMTIRDCTCFVQILIRPDSAQLLKLRLGDFDFKDSLVKFDRWQAQERDLITSGCYTADRIACDELFYEPPTACLLECSANLPGKLRTIQLESNAEMLGSATGHGSSTLKPHYDTHHNSFAGVDVPTLKARLNPGLIESPKTQGIGASKPQHISPRVCR